MIKRSKFFERLFASALLIAVIVGAYAVVVAPLINFMRTTHDGVTEQRVLLGRLRADLDRTTATGAGPDQGAAVRDGIFLAGSSTATRAANLQARLGALVADTNVAILSARTLAPETRDGLAFVGVEVSFRATDTQLLSLLAAIESDRPFLFVDGLQMTPSPSEAAGDHTMKVQSDVTLRVSGAVDQVPG